MRGIFYIGLMVSLCSCGPMVYSYKFSMKESEKPHKLYYQNDTLSMSFKFYLQGLMFDFTNKSDENIKINWDELRMMVNETDKKIQHTQIIHRDFFILRPPSTIGPKSACTDLVVYPENVYYLKENGKEKMKIKDMYPRKGKKREMDSVLKLKGQRITFLLPIEIKNVSHSLFFNFLLKDIKSSRKISAVDILLIPLYLY